MRVRWLAALAISVVAGCLVPHYEVDPPGAAAGGSAALVGGSGPNAPGSNAGSQAASGSAGTGATAGGGVTECEPSQKRCGTECVAKDDVDYGCTETSCNMSACPADESAILACENGACVVGGCGEGSKKCDGKCVAINDPTYGCGEATCDAQNCPHPQTGTLVCNGTSCEVGTCGATTKQCESRCVPLDRNNGCADPGSCTSCDLNQACDGSPSKCVCVANIAETCQGVACGTAKNNCGGDTLCTNTCLNPRPACFGNTCVECNDVADCPGAQGNVCAQATCKSHQCGFVTVAAQTACPGNGTCSATLPGVCTRPAVSVGNYTIDATEVTRGAYAAFVAAKAGNVGGQVSQCSWNMSYDPDPFSPLEVASYDLPVGVDWCDAYAYCQWNNQRLCGAISGAALNFRDFTDPTRSRWTKACMGSSGYVYPYGNAYDGSKCNYPPHEDAEAVASYPGCVGVGSTAKLYDMSGNAFEWEDTCDAQDGPGNLCALRGGSFWFPAVDGASDREKCTSITGALRKESSEDYGFRCCSQ